MRERTYDRVATELAVVRSALNSPTAETDRRAYVEWVQAEQRLRAELVVLANPLPLIIKR